MRRFRWLLVMCLLCWLSGVAIAQDSPLKVVTTTTIIADIAQNVGGDLVTVTSLVPPDADPHAFEPRPVDVVLLSEADMVLANGLGLEAFLGDLLDTVGVTPVIVSKGIIPLGFDDADEGQQEGVVFDCEGDAHTDEDANHDEHKHGLCDPHIWGNPQYATVMVDNITAAFAEADPINTEIYTQNGAAYNAELEALDTEIEDLLADIPPEKRVLVTNHEFLGYFADRYNLTIVGTVLPGVSTLAESTPRELAELGNLIRDTGVAAIFVEASANSRLSDILAAEVGADVQVVTLYSDALSASDGPAATYIDYLRFDAQAIAAALNE